MHVFLVPGFDSWVPPPQLPYLNETYVPDGWNANKNLWLFDVEKDPQERKDVSAVYPDVVNMMLYKLAQYNATAVPAVFPPQDPRSNPELHGGVWGPWED